MKINNSVHSVAGLPASVAHIIITDFLLLFELVGLLLNLSAVN